MIMIFFSLSATTQIATVVEVLEQSNPFNFANPRSIRSVAFDQALTRPNGEIFHAMFQVYTNSNMENN